ncbi:hypothetical protein GSQ33_03735 [Clostridioides difficile]|uniref:hypothetical protein n=1 Tax=Clostridioides difficile TaxID=1496 RepID=UPI0014315610|nr:hypothetical protein [Clostridioides difficile]MCP8340136.1 hypothetical protein [Clostridioides difficile]MCP8383811.1 hypothetical protein [Clostridioides difficile]NJA29039.1 hypothetical protein [Clostridioides difficile]NKN22901.1 hypothetical protein [Clostridioides difficile]
MMVFFNFFEKSATKHQLVYRYGARKGNLTFFKNMSEIRDDCIVFYEKRKTISLFNLTFDSFRSLYGAKKIFHSIVGSNGMAWVVRV